MNLIKNTAFLPFFVMLLMSAGVQAGNQGISFLYGVGVAGVSSDEKAIEHDATGAGEIFVGIEEDGWSLTYSGFKTLEAGTNRANIDYSATLTQTALSYRTIERNNIYYKLSAGQMTANIDYTGAAIPLLKTTGNFMGLGMGLRMDREERMELEYSVYSSDEVDTTHMLTLRYIFGGAPFVGAGAF